MLTSHTLKVKEIRSQTASSKTIAFEIPDELKESYAYIPGQYISIEKPDDKEIRRCYSICSTPADEHLMIGVKKVQGGAMSPFLVEELKEGDTLNISVPEGNIKLDTRAAAKRQYVFIAGGSGVTPIRSMIGHVLANEPSSKVALIYGNRDLENVIFNDYFKDLEQNENFDAIHCLQHPHEDWKGAKGLLTYAKIYELVRRLVKEPWEAHYYICGPGPMMDNAVKVLLESDLRVPKKQIHTEYFTIEVKDENLDKRVSQPIKLLLDEGEKEIQVEPSETILDAAIKAGVELPYSCKLGVCSSCKKRLKSGKVEMKVDVVLSPKEKKAGYILTCQSHPITDNVVVDCESGDKGAGVKRGFSRGIALVIGLLVSIGILIAFTLPEQKSMLALGPMNTGHENLACQDCHSPARGTIMQQIQANIQHVFGQRKEAVTFGSDDVDNKKCLNCHNRPNDRHPVHRFKEPRFREARLAMGVENCESCHSEHAGKRLILTDLGYCVNCHQDTELKDDPIDIPHAKLIAEEQWNTCLQCHDFHGNHIMETAELMKDTIPMAKIREYVNGGADPYSDKKEHVAQETIDAIKDMVSK